MPAVSSVLHDLPRVMRIYRRFAAFSVALAAPAALLLAFFAPDIIGLLYDPRYANACIPMFWLSGAVLFRLTSIVTGTTFITVGRPGLETISMAAGLAAMALFIPAGIALGGLSGAAAGAASAVVMTAAAESLLLRIALKCELTTVLRPWVQALCVMALISGLFRVLRPVLSGTALHNIPFMLVMAATGALASAGIYVLFEGRHPFQDRALKEEAATGAPIC